MRRSIYSLLGFVLVVAAVNVAVSLNGRRLDRAGHGTLDRYAQTLARERPEVVLIGNSMLGQGVHARWLAKLLGRSVVKFDRGGSASAVWYLIVKNVIAPAKPGPKTVVIFFRDIYLTHPRQRVGGDYFEHIRSLSHTSEPLLERLALEKGWAETLVSRLLPAFRYRHDITEGIDRAIKDAAVGRIARVKRGEVQRAIRRSFADRKMDKAQLSAAQDKAEKVDQSDLFDFDANIDRSFLPAIIEALKGAGIGLVFVRVKTRKAAVHGRESKLLKKYIASLKAYLNRAQVPLLDFTYDERITLEHYARGDHLSRDKGRSLFTQILAEALKPLL